MPPHIQYTVGAVYLFFFNTGKKTRMWFLKKRRPCVLLNISSVAISAVCLWQLYPVPASQVGLQQIRAI